MLEDPADPKVIQALRLLRHNYLILHRRPVFDLRIQRRTRRQGRDLDLCVRLGIPKESSNNGNTIPRR